MSPLEALTREANALATGAPAVPGDVAEVDRVMRICNACRYCEGFCAVFPAMTRRLEFSGADIHYLANLCHNCGACLHACQYAPPHEFAVNVPRAMAKVRVATYGNYAWPQSFAGLYKRNGATLAVALAGGLAFFLVLATVMRGTLFVDAPRGNFYDVFPHDLLVGMFAPVFLLAVLALAIGVSRFWRGITPGTATAPAIRETAFDVLRLKYLDGGHGEGCNDADDRFTLWRRRFHHFTFYGFALCFASTCVATVYHYVFGWKAPYDLTSAPVVLGAVGGIGLLVGPIGLAWLNWKRHPLHVVAEQRPMDFGFLTLLVLTSLTGLTLMLGRDSPAMAILLAVHLGSVMAFFVTLPYGKFAHGIYRTAALLKWAIERRQPSRLMLGPD